MTNITVSTLTIHPETYWRRFLQCAFTIKFSSLSWMRWSWRKSNTCLVSFTRTPLMNIVSSSLWGSHRFKLSSRSLMRMWPCLPNQPGYSPSPALIWSLDSYDPYLITWFLSFCPSVILDSYLPLFNLKLLNCGELTHEVDDSISEWEWHE